MNCRGQGSTHATILKSVLIPYSISSEQNRRGLRQSPSVNQLGDMRYFLSAECSRPIRGGRGRPAKAFAGGKLASLSAFLPDEQSGKQRHKKTGREVRILPPLSYQMDQDRPIKPEGDPGKDQHLPDPALETQCGPPGAHSGLLIRELRSQAKNYRRNAWRGLSQLKPHPRFAQCAEPRRAAPKCAMQKM